MQSASLRQKAQIEGEQADSAMVTLVAGIGCLNQTLGVQVLGALNSGFPIFQPLHGFRS